MIPVINQNRTIRSIRSILLPVDDPAAANAHGVREMASASARIGTKKITRPMRRTTNPSKPKLAPNAMDPTVPRCDRPPGPPRWSRPGRGQAR